jgi:hypothetical protein
MPVHTNNINKYMINSMCMELIIDSENSCNKLQKGTVTATWIVCLRLFMRKEQIIKFEKNQNN